MTIELKDVSKQYGVGNAAFLALRDVNLVLNEGDFISVIGPSGSGKTTLLNIMGCLDVPTTGTVLIDGQPTEKLGDFELSKIRKEKIGFVFQDYYLNDSMNALQNVMLPLEFSGRSNKKEEASRLLESVGLGDKLHNFPTELSGGERQRVVIARAMANKPKYLLTDEPTGNLDSVASKKILDLLRKLNSERGVSVVIITHDKDVASIAKKQIKIVDGMVV
ncbi:MAG: ABC transporter ATP-binding protein [Methanocellales archaeon]|nr:ABC transporter ATP-binding protein [Methanocellales archaeon]MDD3421346.1 ABC transporter ATP-binding protein [Methanocellales archaeon]MDD4898905.1 ABC transporter ATP-binding protein [Methanocellales archaeon]MDD5446910.1 ABC transporter ATP-binding protein [Methanocellales archaeon]